MNPFEFGEFGVGRRAYRHLTVRYRIWWVQGIAFSTAVKRVDLI